MNAGKGYIGLDNELAFLDVVGLAGFFSIGLIFLLSLFFFPGGLVPVLHALDFKVCSLLADGVKVVARVARVNACILVNTAEDVTILARYSLELLLMGSMLTLSSTTETLALVLEGSIGTTLAPTHVGDWAVVPHLVTMSLEPRLARVIVGPIWPVPGLIGAASILLPASSTTTHGVASTTSTSAAPSLRSRWTLPIVGVPVLFLTMERLSCSSVVVPVIAVVAIWLLLSSPVPLAALGTEASTAASPSTSMVGVVDLPMISLVVRSLLIFLAIFEAAVVRLMLPGLLDIVVLSIMTPHVAILQSTVAPSSASAILAVAAPSASLILPSVISSRGKLVIFVLIMLPARVAVIIGWARSSSSAKSTTSRSAPMSLLMMVVLKAVAILTSVAVIVLSSIDGTSPVHGAAERVHAALMLLFFTDLFNPSDGNEVHILDRLG